MISTYPCHAHVATMIAKPREPMHCEEPITDALDVCPACSTETPRVRIGRFVDEPRIGFTLGGIASTEKAMAKGTHNGGARRGAQAGAR